MSAPREFFGSRLGFILAAAGSAIGLGNIWRFPYQVADGGGAAFVLMPTLALLLIGLAVWAFTLEGSGPGYSFYLTPSIEDLFDPTVIKQAASQAFLSLSVGMGIMITYASYISKRENVGQEAIVVSLSDFSIAFIGGLVVFPVIFALGLSEEVQGATLGALFISLPGAFAEMGTLGRVVGFSFFLALVVAALTSSVSLLEVGVASIMDELAVSRRTATLTAGLAVAAIGILPATSPSALGVFDKVVGEFLVVSGVLGMSLVVGWVMKDPLSELQEGASPLFRRIAPGAIFTIRYIVPPLVAVIVWFSLRDTFALLFG